MLPNDPERFAAALDLRRRGSAESIEKELREERAGALARSSVRLRDALRRLDAAGIEVGAEAATGAGPEAGAGAGSGTATTSTERERLLQQAADAAFALIVQREALGLHDGEALLDFHGVPRSVRARLGRWIR